TVYLTPFLAASYYSSSEWFCQGFLQVDVPLNRTRVNFGVADPNNLNGSTAQDGSVGWQVLLRLNGQVGCWLYDGSGSGDVLNRIGLLAEMNWTSTLNNAQTHKFENEGSNVTLEVGNFDNRVDVVNMN